MMRQAGRYQKAYRDLAKRHPSFRERSETTDLIVEISLQPWKSFKPDGVILFRSVLPSRHMCFSSCPADHAECQLRDTYVCRSDILTPLPALGVPFEIDDAKGPIIDRPVRSMEQASTPWLAWLVKLAATALSRHQHA